VRARFDPAPNAKPLDHLNHVSDDCLKLEFRKTDPAAFNAMEPVLASHRVELDFGNMPELAPVAAEGLPALPLLDETLID
jgi:hypothetical protein